MKSRILLIHAWSAIYSYGKPGTLNRIQKSVQLQLACEVFGKFASVDEISTAGLQCLVILYGGKENK